MKRFGDFLVNTPVALVVGCGAALFAVLGLVPALREIAWVLLLLSALLTACAVAGWARTWTILQRRIDELAEMAAAVHDTYAPVELTQTPQEEDAEADSRAAADILERFPQDAGITRRLRVEAEVTEFPSELTAPVTAFLDEHLHTSFEDPYAHRAFMDLYRSTRALADWIEAETEVHEGTRSVIPGDRREGGWQSFAEAKRAGESAADAFLRHRAEFSRTVLVSRILEPEAALEEETRAAQED